MSAVHLHLLLNHIPVIGFPGAVLLLIGGLWRKSDELTNTGLVALVVVALLTIPAFLTGDPASDVVRHLPGVSRTDIQAHEDSADASFTAIEIAGVAALLTLLANRFKPSLRRWMLYLALAAAIVGSVMVGYTSNLGGKIRHSEIRDGASPSAQAGAPAAQTNDD